VAEDALLRCLRCGGELTPTNLHPSSAPWICLADHHGYFEAELTTDARLSYRRQHHDFGAATPAIREAVQAEVHAAHARGSSMPLRLIEKGT